MRTALRRTKSQGSWLELTGKSKARLAAPVNSFNQWRFFPSAAQVQTVPQTPYVIEFPTSQQPTIPILDEQTVPPIVGDLLNTETLTINPDSERWPMMVPDFWTGTLPRPESDFKIDCADMDLTSAMKDEIPESLKTQMRANWEKCGLVLLRNTGLTDVNEMKKLVDVIIPHTMTYEGGANSRRGLEGARTNEEQAQKNVYDTGAPGIAHLHYHHEMAYVGESVKQVAFMCTKSPGRKIGASFVSDGVKSSEKILSTPLGQKLAKLGVCYVRCLTDRKQYEGAEKGWNGSDEVGVYNHWQQSFGTEDPKEVERKAARRGLKVEWGENGYCKTKYYTSAFEYFEPLDKNLMYSSLADDSIWFDTWPGVMQLPTMHDYENATAAERPLKLLFGDDSEFSREELQQFLDVYDDFGMPIYWDKVGDIAIMCNWRWAHGRPAFELLPGEQREIGVVLGETFKRQGQVEGKF